MAYLGRPDALSPAVIFRQWRGLGSWQSLNWPLSPGRGRLDQAEWEQLGLLGLVTHLSLSLHSLSSILPSGQPDLLQEGSGLQRCVLRERENEPGRSCNPVTFL